MPGDVESVVEDGGFGGQNQDNSRSLVGQVDDAAVAAVAAVAAAAADDDDDDDDDNDDEANNPTSLPKATPVKCIIPTLCMCCIACLKRQRHSKQTSSASTHRQFAVSAVKRCRVLQQHASAAAAAAAAS